MSYETFDVGKSAFLLFIAESVHCLDLLEREMHIKLMHFVMWINDRNIYSNPCGLESWLFKKQEKIRMKKTNYTT